jgi:4-hydroxybenzoate polyprenyltransferase
LGFLAVLASVRSQSINAVVGQNTYPLNPLIDTTLLLMSLYAIFMVFAYSKDMIGESFAQTFKTLALGVLSLSFMVLIVFGVFYGVVLYQNRLIYLVGVIAVPIAYLSYVKINEIRKKANKEKSVTMKLPTKKNNCWTAKFNRTCLVNSDDNLLFPRTISLDFLYNRKCKYGCIVIPC